MSEEETPEERVAVCVACCWEVTWCDEDRCCATCGYDIVVCADRHSAEMLMEQLKEQTDSALAERTRALDQQRARLAEAEAEIAAYQGRPEGAINERWTWDGATWACGDTDTVSAFTEADADGTVAWRIDREPLVTVCAEGCEHEVEKGAEISGTAPTHRTAQRAAEAAAVARGWAL